MNAIVNVPPATWTQLTTGVVVGLTFQVLYSDVKGTPYSAHPLNSPVVTFVGGVHGAGAPASVAGFEYRVGEGEIIDALATYFPGVAGVDTLWAYSEYPVRIFVSHV